MTANSHCLLTGDVAALAHGDVEPASDADAMREHIQRCDSCRRAVAAAARVATSGPSEADADGSIETEALRPGETVDGRYRIEGQIGRGGMGVVYGGWDTQLHRRVALKVIATPSDDETSRRSSRLIEESRAMARLRHPNVVSVYDAGHCRVGAYVVMELVEGATLRAWWSAQRRDPNAVLDRCLEAGRGLAAAHAVGLIHRDFKPDNVLVDADGRAMVADFGLARPKASQLLSEHSESPSAEPRVGTRVGTPGYMAPEQRAGSEVDVRADIYSFSVTLQEALASTSGAGSAIVVLPRWLRAIVEHGRAEDPSARPASMEVLVASIERARRHRSHWRRAAVAIVVALPLGFAVWQGAPAPQHCRLDPDKTTAWSSARLDAIDKQFAATEVVDANTDARLTRQAIAEFGERWEQTWTEVCRDGLRDGAAANTEGRSRCLDRQRHLAEGLTTLLVRASADTVTHATKAARALPEPRHCASSGFVEGTALPLDDDARAATEDAQALLLQQEIRFPFVSTEEAIALADEALRSAKAAGHGATISDALTSKAELVRHGDPEQSLRLCEEALLAAERAGYTLGKVKAWRAIAWTTQVVQDVERGRRAVGRARAVLETIGDDPAFVSELISAQGALARMAGDRELATALHREALAIAETEFGPHSEEAARHTGNLAIAMVEISPPDETLAVAQRAAELMQLNYAPRHPKQVGALTRLGMAYSAAQRTEDALNIHREALALAQRVLEPEHRARGFSMQNVGTTLSDLGRDDDALLMFDRALTQLDTPANRSYQWRIYLSRGESHWRKSDHRAARRDWEKALAIATQYVPDHPYVSELRERIAEVDAITIQELNQATATSP